MLDYQKLKVLRQASGLSQNEVAEKLGITRQAISRWENGRSYPELDNLTILADLYQVTLDELTGKPRQMIEKSGDESQLLLVMLLIGFLVPIAGLVLSAYVWWRNREGNKYFQLIRYMSVGVFIFQLFMAYGLIFSPITHW